MAHPKGQDKQNNKAKDQTKNGVDANASQAGQANETRPANPSRRLFLRGAGALVAVATTGTAAASCATNPLQQLTAPAQPLLPADPNSITTMPTALGGPNTAIHLYPELGGENRPMEFFRPHEVRTVEAITARILPGTPDDPGAREAGVVYYIDGVLSSGLGYGEPTFRQPPYALGYDEESPPTAAELDSAYGVVWLPSDQLERYGYQSVLTPREVYRVGLAALDRYSNSEFGSNFVDLSEEQQDTIVEALANDEAEGFDDPSAETFFELLREHTIEGMFSDPIYGGNRNLVGWRLVGFPGSQRGYTVQEMKTEGYRREPQGLSDLHQYHPGQTNEPNVLLPIQGSEPHGHE